MMSLRHLLVSGTALACCMAGGAAVSQGLAPGDPAIAASRDAFIDRMVAEHEFDRVELTELLEGASIEQTILDRISRPAERVVPWFEYRQIFLNDSRIAAGATFWMEHADLITRVSGEYGVAPEIILAIVGVESLFGQRMGSFPVLDSLATLAFAYPPRARFFSAELEQFLLTARQEGPAHLEVLGSYAGAMGAGQFISSSYEAYAVDGDGDGHRDLWASWPDILGSVANYFARHGWRTGEPVVVPASRADKLSGTLAQDLELDTTLGSLRESGLLFELDFDDSTPAMLIGLESGPDSVEQWIGLHNFRVITRYNRSVKYALAVFQLSEAIAGAYDSQTGNSQ